MIGITDLLMGSPKSPLQGDMQYGIGLAALYKTIDDISTYLMNHEDKELERQLKELQIVAMKRELGMQGAEEGGSSSGPVMAKGIAKADPSFLQSILDFKNPPIAPMGKLFQFPGRAVSAGKASSSLLRNIRFP